VEVLASLVFISGLSNKITFNKELWTSISIKPNLRNLFMKKLTRESNKDTVVRYVRALSSAFKFIRDPAKRTDVLKTIVETTGFAGANAQLTLALYFEPVGSSPNWARSTSRGWNR
jgi:ABC-type nitrate/sulfonate/bicarbonate transport system substrate-binding protein